MIFHKKLKKLKTFQTAALLKSYKLILTMTTQNITFFYQKIKIIIRGCY